MELDAEGTLFDAPTPRAPDVERDYAGAAPLPGHEPAPVQLPKDDALLYERFFPADDVAAYKRVKRGTMQLARVARDTVAALVGGQITQRDGSKKEYLVTQRGTYRLAMSANSDNRTEMREHERMGAEVVVMGDDDAMRGFFSDHGFTDADAIVRLMHSRIRARLGQGGE